MKFLLVVALFVVAAYANCTGAATAPQNASAGCTDDALNDGSECTITCNTDFAASGPTTCTGTDLTAATCIAYCDFTTAPTDGQQGACTAKTAPGSSCLPTCDTGFTVTGPSNCLANGTANPATCTPNASTTTTTAAPAPASVGALFTGLWIVCSALFM